MQNTYSEQLNTKGLGTTAEWLALPVHQIWRPSDPRTASEVRIF